MIAGEVWAMPGREGRCAYCGAWCWARQWHHRRPSQKRRLRELGKCDLVCPTCHRDTHRLESRAPNRTRTVRGQLEWIRSQLQLPELVREAAVTIVLDRAGELDR